MLHMATDFHLMPYVMTLLESHNCQTVVSSLCLTDAVIHARRHIIAPSLRNECVIRIFQLFTAQLEETHSNFGTDVHVLILREFSRVSYNSLPAIQDWLSKNDCAPDCDVIAAVCDKRLRENLAKAAKAPLFKNLHCVLDMPRFLALIDEILLKRSKANLTTTLVKSDRVLRSHTHAVTTQANSDRVLRSHAHANPVHVKK